MKFSKYFMLQNLGYRFLNIRIVFLDLEQLQFRLTLFRVLFQAPNFILWFYFAFSSKILILQNIVFHENK